MAGGSVRGQKLTIDRVITVGLGMLTVPSMFVPSGSARSWMVKFVMEKPARLLRPRTGCEWIYFGWIGIVHE